MGSLQGPVFPGGFHFAVHLWAIAFGVACSAVQPFYTAADFVLHVLYLLYRLVVLYAGVQAGNLLGLVAYHFLYIDRMHASKKMVEA